jgi:hypothetical protein
MKYHVALIMVARDENAFETLVVVVIVGMKKSLFATSSSERDCSSVSTGI